MLLDVSNFKRDRSFANETAVTQRSSDVRRDKRGLYLIISKTYQSSNSQTRGEKEGNSSFWLQSEYKGWGCVAINYLFGLTQLERTFNNVHDKCTFLIIYHHHHLVSNSPRPFHLFTQRPVQTSPAAAMVLFP